MVKAVLDVGSNSVLLLVARKAGDGWIPVFESSAVTGLGYKTKSTGLLDDQAQTRTLRAIAEAFSKARNLGADSIFAGGTMALRIARNTEEFLQKAADQGTPIQVISGEEEAELGFLAVANDPLFASEQTLTIIDPGGHSTELVTATRTPNGWNTLLRKSFPVGALGLRESVMNSETPSFADRLAAVDEIDSLIGLEYLPNRAGKAVSLGATGTNLISIKEKLSTWEPNKVHGAILDFEEVSRAVGWLCDMTDAQRSEIPGLEKGREGTIHIGSLILERFMQVTHVLDCTVSIRGWRHALLERD
ncbi:hypothetical protein QPK87_39145 [Kamptonema cortianum]|nr:hypothetical protein [Geitlerinema splendidum]MDK3162520.1 hypothetical protein [Kamptonema cortianum]